MRTAQRGLNGTSLQMGNMTFSYCLVFVNGVQLHYVIGGHGPPVVDDTDGQKTWTNLIMPALARRIPSLH